jgi:Skp family chaperone for outer membrane proteins
MPRNCARIALVAVAFASLAVAGCGSQQAKTAPPDAPPKIGAIDMEKAIKAHPRYAEVGRLQQDYATLAARLEAEKAKEANMPGLMAPGDASGLEQAAAKEFDARMEAKRAEINTRLDAAANQVNRDMASELDAYAAELDKEYQPQLFSLQLKLKTVQLSKEEGAALQGQVDKLQQERAAKIDARRRELLAKADAAMKTKQSDGEKELAAFAAKEQSELAGQIAAQQAAAAGRIAAPGQTGGAAADKLDATGREIAALQDAIVADIRDKAAKVAVNQGLATVLAGIKVNVSAVDITDAVIAEFKK